MDTYHSLCHSIPHYFPDICILSDGKNHMYWHISLQTVNCQKKCVVLHGIERQIYKYKSMFGYIAIIP